MYTVYVYIIDMGNSQKESSRPAGRRQREHRAVPVYNISAQRADLDLAKSIITGSF